MQLPWYVPAALAVLSVLTFLWASGAMKSRKVRSAKRSSAGAGASGRAPKMTGGGANVLAWATFALTAFGTVSSFVLSLLTYLHTVG
jgi:hypothetical protein